MTKDDARVHARNLFIEVLKTQPNVAGGNTPTGSRLATYCSEFIEQYSEYLMTRK